MVKRSQHYSSDQIPLKHATLKLHIILHGLFQAGSTREMGVGKGGGGGGFSETVKAKYYNQTWYTN